MSTTSPVRTLSKRESQLLSAFAAAGQSVFTIEDARRVLGRDEDDAVQILYRLVNKQWLQRLERGKYSVIPLEAGPEVRWAEHEYVMASVFVSPYYLTYATTLHYYGYSERLPRQVWIATTRRKRSVTTGNLVFRFVYLHERKFFGYTTIQIAEQPVQIAEREKAIVDGFDHPQYCGGVLEPAKGLWFGRDELDFERLIDYGLRLGNRAATRRLGFWLDRLELAGEDLLSQLRFPEDRNYNKLDPVGLDDGPRDARWRLIINIPEHQLLEWQEH
jgi:predicted transcriptional regulator of viral defense system